MSALKYHINIFDVMAFGVIVSILMLSGCDSTSRPPSASSAPKVANANTTPIPKYEIISREHPNRTALVWHAIISGVITEEGIQHLLQNLLSEAEAVRGSQFHGGRPSAIVIWLYTSREHFNSGMGQWIAKIRRGSIDGPVEQKVKSELISQLTEQPRMKHGFSESDRMEISRAITIAQDRATHEAWQRYPLRGDPLADPDNFHPTGDEKAQFKLESQLHNQLRQKYEADVARRYGLTTEQFDDIRLEGLSKNWPLPTYSRRDALQDPDYFKRHLRVTSKVTAKVQKPVEPKLPADVEEIAASKLKLALALLRRNKTDKATQRLQDIVDDYPDTEAGKEAAKMLEK